jgi:single-stranded DNA-binding protein
MSEFKKFDSDDKYLNHSARLTKDPEVFPSKDPTKPPMVRLTFVSTSRQEKSKDIWIEAKVRDRDANIACFLKKGDTLPIEGKILLEEFNGKLYHKLEQAQVHINVELLMACKTRGFVGGSKAAIPAGPKKAPRPVIDLGDDE